jgi:hypothetical protein
MSELDPPIFRVLGEVARLEREKSHNAVLRDVNTVVEPTTPVRVAAADCGPSGTLGLGRLVDLVWHIRQLHLLEFYDVDVAAMARRWGGEWSIESVSARSMMPIRPLEEILIRTRVIDATPTACGLEAWVLDRAGKRLKALVRLRLVHHAITTGEETRPPDSVVALLARVRIEAGAADLDARCREVAAALRKP